MNIEWDLKVSASGQGQGQPAFNAGAFVGGSWEATTCENQGLGTFRNEAMKTN
jgi:hypothetical protein